MQLPHRSLTFFYLRQLSKPLTSSSSLDPNPIPKKEQTRNEKKKKREIIAANSPLKFMELIKKFGKQQLRAHAKMENFNWRLLKWEVRPCK